VACFTESAEGARKSSSSARSPEGDAHQLSLGTLTAAIHDSPHVRAPVRCRFSPLAFSARPRSASGERSVRVARAGARVCGIVAEPPSPKPPRSTARRLARAVENGSRVGEALRHLDSYGDQPDAKVLAEALARFLVPRCESNHAGWHALRRVVVDSSAEVPWEKCARRAIPHVAEDLLDLSREKGRTPLARAQHVAAQRRAEQIARHVDPESLMKSLGLRPERVREDRWSRALIQAVEARSREQVARAIERTVRG
jgi:hypothetical protein